MFITLPTPKQEILAEYLKNKFKYFKIICIGGSINIFTGEERQVPDFFYNLEFLWRLRYETRRRLTRLFSTFKNFIIGKYITRVINNITFKKI